MIWKYEYKIVDSGNWSEIYHARSFLKNKVSALSNKGWIPVGGMMLESEIDTHDEYVTHKYVYVQAMIRKHLFFVYYWKDWKWRKKGLVYRESDEYNYLD